VNPWARAAGQGIHALNPVDAGDSPSIGGFLGNLVGGAWDVVQGVGSLIGQGVHDLVQLAHGPSALEHPENFQLFQTAKALPEALAHDYQSRYGWDDFSHGDIWGGIKEIGSGLYNNPIAYIGDALMVGGAATKAASAGRLAELEAMGARVPAIARALPSTKLLPDAMAESILGPGTREAMSLTGSATEPVRLGQSINPVTRFVQNQMYDAFSLSPKKALAWAELRNPDNPAAAIMDIGAYKRADEAQILAEARGLDILRPTFSKSLENRFTSRTMGLLGINAKNRTTSLSTTTLKYVNELDDAGKAVLPDALQGTLSIEGPSLRPTMRIIDEAFEAQYGVPAPALTDGLNRSFIEPLAKDMSPGQWTRLESTNPMSPGANPSNLAGATGTHLAVYSTEATLGDAPAILKHVEDVTGHELVAVENGFADAGSYDGYRGTFRDPKTGQISKVDVVTETLLNEQAKWASNQRQIARIESETNAIDTEINAARMADEAADVSGLEARRIVLEDELNGARASSAYTFRHTRRLMNAETAGIEYNPILQAADKINALSHMGTAAVELSHGVLTYRKMWDRAFLPMRANRHASLMNDIERDLADYFQAVTDSHASGAGLQGLAAKITGETPQEASLLGAVEIISNRLGTGHPAITKAVRELIENDIDNAITHTNVDEVIPFQTPDVMPEGLNAPEVPLHGRLATGEKTLKSNWWGTTDPVEAAKFVRQRIYALTHESIVVQGEFPSFSWKDMLAQAEGDPLQEIPTYFPHLKSSKFTGEALNFKGKQQTQLLSETARMDKNEAVLFESGLYEKDPALAYSRVYAQIAKHDETRDALFSIAEKYGRTPTEDELKAVALGIQPTGEVYLSKNGVNAMLEARKTFITIKHDAMMQGLTPEQATMDALREVSDRALRSFQEGAIAADEIYAIPAHVARLMDRFAKPFLQLPPKASFFYSSIMNGWKTAVLGLSPRWLVNNTLGNLVYMGVKDPGAIKYYLELLMSPKKRAYVEAMFGDRLTQTVYRDFMSGELSDATYAERALQSGQADLAAKLEAAGNTKAAYLAKPVRWTSRKIFHLNKVNEDAARMGVAISAAQRHAQLNWMSKVGSTWKTMGRIMDEGFGSDPREYEGIARQVDAVLGDYLRMSPAEKAIKQYLIPFYPFYRHTAMFVAKMPFESPFKAEILRQIHLIDDEMKGPLPDYMAGGQATEVAPNYWVRIGNVNPLAAVTESYAPALTNPLLSLTIQRLTGTNPFGEPWRPPPGTLVESFAGSQYEILRNPDGSFAGVQPITGTWQPPLMQQIMGMVPQYGLITGVTPFKPKSFPARAFAMSGASTFSFDQAKYAASQAQQQAQATVMGANAAVRYP